MIYRLATLTLIKYLFYGSNTNNQTIFNSSTLDFKLKLWNTSCYVKVTLSNV